MEPPETVILHKDDGLVSELRNKVFGHAGAIIPFKEGLIAKLSREREFFFYRNFKSWIHEMLPMGILPNVRGVGFFTKEDGDQIELSLYPTLVVPQNASHVSYLILEDVIHGYSRPAVLDVKLGTRTWEIGADDDKVSRHKAKCATATTSLTSFRIRAAMWYSKTGRNLISSDVSMVDRMFGMSCGLDEMMDFMRDFFYDPDLIPEFIEKLKQIRVGIERLRVDAGVRMFSSSALFVYDENDKSKVDCRILDFEKTYFNIESTAARHNESIEECEDDVVNGIDHLIEKLSSLHID